MTPTQKRIVKFFEDRAAATETWTVEIKQGDFGNVYITLASSKWYDNNINMDCGKRGKLVTMHLDDDYNYYTKKATASVIASVYLR